ncbi:MAG: EFR1 family ferrodoxin [Lachnospiraceae bacterium]
MQSMPYLLKQDQEIVSTASCVGFVFPCYFDDAPQLVRDFIGKINLDSATYIFAIVTAGGSIGNTFKTANLYLAKKNKKIDYGKALFLSGNYILGWHYTFTNKYGEKLDKALQRFDKECIQTAKDIQNRNTRFDRGSFFINILSHVGRENKVAKDTRHWDSKFAAGNSCNGCATCKKVCAVENIVMENGKPKFLHNCQRCMACIQFCPKNAILVKEKQIKRNKYHHPSYSAL